MFKKLVIPFLALSITALGACSSSSSSSDGGSGGKSGTGGAGTGGAGTGGAGTGGAGTGGAGTGGAGTGGAGTGGTVVDAPADMSTMETATETATETAHETGAETAANICAAYTGNGMLAGISASDFCKEYATSCTFTGAMHYSSMGDCMTSYGGTSTTNQTCRAGHLCNAVAAGGTTT
ncbi:MAG TPA: hypothetical protein VNO55_30725, partial [Polyangia bacterium]|nr:hypothetical protein [Polyangia bacterium]